MSAPDSDAAFLRGVGIEPAELPLLDTYRRYLGCRFESLTIGIDPAGGHDHTVVTLMRGGKVIAKRRL